MSIAINIVADLLLAVLLAAAIASSLALSRRITRLKADETAMRTTVADLVVATETAERAIAGLRTTLGDCDRTLADRLRTAERYAADLAEQVSAGEKVMRRIAEIVHSSRGAAPRAAGEVDAPQPPVGADAGGARVGAAAAAAQALAERVAQRLERRAA